jgi:integrase
VKDTSSNRQPALNQPLPDFERLKSLVLDTVSSSHSRRVYAAALDEFFAWYRKDSRGPFSKAVVQRYRRELAAGGWSAGSINHRLTALRKLATEAADNGLMDTHLGAGIVRVGGVRQQSRSLSNWLSLLQAEALLNAPDPSTLKGKRDRAILAVMIGCGLRRSEIAALDYLHMQQRENRWIVVNLVGKGGRMRSVAMPAWAKSAVTTWLEAAGLKSGRIFRAVRRGGRVTDEAMTPHSIYAVVTENAFRLRLKLAPHDLRRTHAKLAYSGGSRLEQIQLALGHSSIQTTERYLGTEQDFGDAPCDRLGLRSSKALEL